MTMLYNYSTEIQYVQIYGYIVLFTLLMKANNLSGKWYVLSLVQNNVLYNEHTSTFDDIVSIIGMYCIV